MIYAANEFDGSITILDGATNASSTLAMDGPADIMVNSVTNTVYIENIHATVTVLDDATVGAR